MSDLISRSAAICCLGNSPEQMCMPWSEMERMLRELPTIDAVPVVRCKDCRWWDTEDDEGHGYCFCQESMRYVRGDFYCADGERWEADADTP